MLDKAFHAIIRQNIRFAAETRPCYLQPRVGYQTVAFSDARPDKAPVSISRRISVEAFVCLCVAYTAHIG
jgi:hypothetical protein